MTPGIEQPLIIASGLNVGKEGPSVHVETSPHCFYVECMAHFPQVFNEPMTTSGNEPYIQH